MTDLVPSAPNPNPAPPPPLSAPSAAAPPPPPSPCRLRRLPPRPPIRVTSEYDSENSLFLHKVSTKLLDSLAKLKLTFQNDAKGGISFPQLGLLTKNFSVLYDVESRNALLKGEVAVSEVLKLRATHDVKEQQGHVTMITTLSDPSYKLELSSSVPAAGLPRATLRFPLGEVSLEEKETVEANKVLSINGILKGQLLNGVCTALYKDNDLNLRYSYKDAEMSFIPSVSLPSNALSFAFKRQLSPSDKLSYWYHFDSSTWSTVYKHTAGKDLKFKAGFDSEVRLGWASLWVGDENGRAKTAPKKTKVQFMFQVPQDDIGKSAIMFRVKRRKALLNLSETFKFFFWLRTKCLSSGFRLPGGCSCTQFTAIFILQMNALALARALFLPKINCIC